jgi:peroxiredoxin
MNQRAYQLPASAKDVHPILIGAKVPKLTLTTVKGNSFALNAAITEKPTVLIFYRGHW